MTVPESSGVGESRLRVRCIPNAGTRWRRAGGIWLFYLLGPLIAAWRSSSLVVAVVGSLLLLAFSVAYLFGFPRVWPAARRRRDVVLVSGTLVILSAASIALIGPSALATWVFVAVTWVVLLRWQIAVPLVLALAAAALVVPQHVPGWHVRGPEWSLAASIAFASFAVLAVVRANQSLAAARAEVAQLAAERERLRIARDLHDLLGHSLTTITVKAALAARLADRDLTRARNEIADVEALARRTLADVRAAVAGYRDVRLATEIATAREVLAAAGIEADLPRVVDDVPAELAGLFGWVVREGVTNVVRHSQARRVRITVDQRVIEVVDDGVGVPSAVPDAALAASGSGERGGHGLLGLAERVAAAGGRLITGPADGFGAPGFRLRVEVPALALTSGEAS